MSFLSWCWAIHIIGRRHTIEHGEVGLKMLEGLRRDYDFQFHSVDSLGFQKSVSSIPILLIRVQPKKVGVPPFGSYKACIVPGLITLIFLPDPPEELNNFQRFFAMHEIGHASTKGVMVSLNQQMSWLRLLALYMPLLFLTNWVGKALILILILMQWTLDSAPVHAELYADRFAIKRLLALVPENEFQERMQAVQRTLERYAKDDSIDARGQSAARISQAKWIAVSHSNDERRRWSNDDMPWSPMLVFLAPVFRISSLVVGYLTFIQIDANSLRLVAFVAIVLAWWGVSTDMKARSVALELDRKLYLV